MVQKITKYIAWDGEEFSTICDAGCHERKILKTWLSLNLLKTFIDEADKNEEHEYYETDRERRLCVMSELYKHCKGEKCGTPDTFDTYIQSIKLATASQINAIQQAIAARD